MTGSSNKGGFLGKLTRKFTASEPGNTPDETVEDTAPPAASAPDTFDEFAVDDQPEIDLQAAEEPWGDEAPTPFEAPLLRPEEWDQSVPVYQALSAHIDARDTPEQLADARRAVNEKARNHWRKRARRVFRAVMEKDHFAASLPAPRGFLRAHDVLTYPKLQYAMTRGINWYASNHGFEPSIFQPRRFSEKLLVTKLFAPLPMPSAADKLSAHTYIPPAWRDTVRPAKRFWQSFAPQIPDEIDAPPGVYFLKANHSSGANQKITLPLTEQSRDVLTEVATRWLEFDYGERGGEWWYQPIQRQVYIEESFSRPGESAPDWKFFVMGGRVLLVQVDINRDSDHVQLLYDRDFTFLPVELFYKSGEPIEKPANFETMRSAAEAIGRQFEFARVDLYNTDDGIVLGEITFAPGGGRLRLRSPELDLWLGEQWKSSFFQRGWRPKSSPLDP